MKRKALFIVSSLLISILLFSGCNNTNPEEIKRIETSENIIEEVQVQEEVKNAEEKQEENFVFTYNNIKINLGISKEEVIELLGEPANSFEATDCASDNKIITLDYPDFELYVDCNESSSTLSSIIFKNDVVQTTEGLAIGDSKEKMEELYGTDYKERGIEYTYKKGNTILLFQIGNNNISYIAYELIN